MPLYGVSDPVSKLARITSCPAVVTSAPAPATTVADIGSEQLTDEGEEHNPDGSMRDVRLHRLFLQDSHAKRSECLKRGMW